MSDKALSLELSNLLAMPEDDLIRKDMLALIEKEIRLAELEIASIRDRYSVFSIESFHQAIKDGSAVEHPAWEDYIVWNNKEVHIARLKDLAERS